MSLWVWVVAYLAVGVAIPVIVLLGFDVLADWLERIGRNNDPV